MNLTDHPRLRELLAAILAAPEDDGPRLAYADALAELGDGDRAAQERAEFVMVGVELAGYESPQYPGLVVCEGKGGPARAGSRKRCRCRPCVLRRRERELLDAADDGDELPHRVRWLGTGDPSYLLHDALRPEYRRGFVERLTCPAAALAHLDAVREVQPVTKVTLTTWPDPAELTALTTRRGKRPGVADTEETSATRWCLRRLWPGIEEWTLPGGRAAVT